MLSFLVLFNVCIAGTMIYYQDSTLLLYTNDNGYRLLLSLTPTNRMLSAISHIYLLRTSAVAFDWRTAFETEMMSSRLASSKD